MNLSKLISPKVVAATSGAGAGAIVSGFLVWLIGASAYGVGFAAADADAAVAAVPIQITGMISLVLTVVGAFIPGYQTTDPARSAAAAPSADPEDVDPADQIIDPTVPLVFDTVGAPDRIDQES